MKRFSGRQSTFTDRRYTKQNILDEATSIVFPTRGDNRKLIRFSEYQMNRRAKLFGHIIRCGNYDPMRQVSFLPDLASRVEYGTKRVGKPRQNWLHHTKKDVFEHILVHHERDESLDDGCVYAAAVGIFI